MGTTKLSPGSSTAWNLPQRSMTSACCCGTTRMVWTMMMIATMNSASVTREEPMSMSISRASGGGGPAVGENQHRSARSGDVHGLGLLGVGCRELGVPGRAAIAHSRRAVRSPALDANHLADVERRLPRRGAAAALPPFQD